MGGRRATASLENAWRLPLSGISVTHGESAASERARRNDSLRYEVQASHAPILELKPCGGPPSFLSFPTSFLPLRGRKTHDIFCFIYARPTAVHLRDIFGHPQSFLAFATRFRPRSACGTLRLEFTCSSSLTIILIAPLASRLSCHHFNIAS